jgi:acyl carrier protein
MIAKKYEVKVAPAELKACVTIQDVYDLIQSKK